MVRPEVTIHYAFPSHDVVIRPFASIQEKVVGICRRMDSHTRIAAAQLGGRNFGVSRGLSGSESVVHHNQYPGRGTALCVQACACYLSISTQSSTAGMKPTLIVIDFAFGAGRTDRSSPDRSRLMRWIHR